MSNKDFQWDEASWTAYRDEIDKKERRRGTFTYLLAFCLVFVLCIAVLVVVLLVDSRVNGSDVPPADDVAVYVSQKVLPSTVLIYETTSTSYSYGTGFFITPDGYIVTNAHVVAGCNTLKVQCYGEETWIDATVIGTSAVDDLALIKINKKNCVAVTVGSSADLKIGETAIAIGNPDGEEGAFSTTQGIVSALSRQIETILSQGTADTAMIQFDAAVNPGNSGGPLCNAQGEVIGVVTRKKTTDNFEGMAYALPIDGVVQIVSALKAKNYNVKNSPITVIHPKLGINAIDVIAGESYDVSASLTVVPSQNGVLVSSVYADMNADGKLQRGDLIIAADGLSVTTRDALQNLLSGKRLGDGLTLKVIRDGSEITVLITLDVYE